MDIGTLSALTKFNYQTAVQKGEGEATLKAALPPPQAAIGGLGYSTLSTLFSSTGENASDGFTASVNLASTLALTGYSAHQQGLSGTVRTAAKNAPSTFDPNPTDSVQSAVASAQSALLSNSLDLLA